MRPFETAQTSPDSATIDVPSYGVIVVEGVDAESFLQGQLTCDLSQLAEGQWVRGGHCDARGKLWSTFIVLRNGDRFYLIQPKATIEASLKELQKFGVFSKVEFLDLSDSMHFIACAGADAYQALQSVIPQVSDPATTIIDGQPVVRLAENLYLAGLNQAIEGLQPEDQWTLVTIANGWPQLAASQQQQFIPQMLNLDILNGINFKKGCYIGQETVARMHYKGQVKKRTFRLMGNANELPAPGTQLEKQLGENWRRAGEILQSVWYNDGVVALLAVMSADTESETRLRIKGQDDSQFTICPES